MKKMKLFLIAALAVTLFSFTLPAGWIKAGSAPESYDMGIDQGAGQDGKNAATIKSNTKKLKVSGHSCKVVQLTNI